MFNWVINFIPVLGTVAEWVKKLFNVKLIAFLAFKALLVFMFFNFLPFLFGQFVQWLGDIGSSANSGFDLSFLDVLTKPQFTGIGGWLFTTSKIDVCIRIMISGALVRLGVKRIPFIG